MSPIRRFPAEIRGPVTGEEGCPLAGLPLCVIKRRREEFHYEYMIQPSMMVLVTNVNMAIETF